MELAESTNGELLDELRVRLQIVRQQGDSQVPLKTNAPQWDIVCDECGKNAQVPFKPKEGWRKLCIDCYKKHKR